MSRTLRSSSGTRITLKDAEHVVKTGPEEYLRGELHFYRSIPPELAHLFPRLIEASDKLTPGLPSLTITKASRIDEWDVPCVFSDHFQSLRFCGDM